MNNDNAPLYVAICESLAEHIGKQSPRYFPKLPSERHLMDEFSTTRVTLRIALSQLERDGLIYRSNRRGWFVTPPKLTFDPTARSNFSIMAMQQGRRPATEVLNQQPATCRSQAEGAPLGLKRGDKLVRLDRRRSIDGRHVLLENILINADMMPGFAEHDLSTSLTTISQEFYGIEVAKEEVTINATALNRFQAETLAVADGSFCLFISRIRYDQDNRPFEYDQEWWLHNAIEIHTRSER